MDGLAGVVLAAGEGKRLRPLTALRPKPLCPVANRALLDLALDAVTPLVEDVSVNAHHLADQVLAHLSGRDVHVAVEPVLLGTAGALGNLRERIAGRPVLVANGDAWRPGSLDALLAGWDGERVRLLTVHDPARGDFGALRHCGAALLPWFHVARLPAEPGGLYELMWREEHRAGRLDLVQHDGAFLDCGTPADYLRANLAASGGTSVIGEGARVDGELVRSVVWPGGVVRAGERLVDAIRVGSDLTLHPVTG